MMREPLMKVKFLGVLDIPLILVLGGFFLVSFFVNSIYDVGLISGDVAHFSGLLVGIFIIGVIYQETIDIFYNWLFIAFGFWVIEYALSDYFSRVIIDFAVVLYELAIVFVGLFLIVYSYFKLRRIESVGGIEDE